MDIDTFDRLSEISYRLECGTELLYALFCALRHDDYTAKDFAPVMEAGHLYFSHLRNCATIIHAHLTCSELPVLRCRRSPGVSPPRSSALPRKSGPASNAQFIIAQFLNDDLHKLIRQQEGALSHDR